jgi:peptidoglycan hydrolase-like protein with peptidoglycan-binding domain
VEAGSFAEPAHRYVRLTSEFNLPTRNIFGPGAIGEIIKQIQVAPTDAGFDTKETDGWYGQNTSAAVAGYQGSQSLPSTGVIDEASWQLLMQSLVPSVSDRSLQLTPSFEGHGFGLAVGNFDDALLTWGIIGFTLASREIQQIINTLNQAHPELVQAAFQSHAGELLSLLQAFARFPNRLGEPAHSSTWSVGRALARDVCYLGLISRSAGGADEACYL